MSNNGDNAEEKLAGNAAHIVADEGEPLFSRGDPSQGDHSKDDSMEYIRTIKKRMRKILPLLPDMTLLTLLGEKSGNLSLVWN